MSEAPRSTLAWGAARLASAALAGAAGLGLETVLLGTAGIALGYGRAAALGLATWIAAWALGAYWAGRGRFPLRIGPRAGLLCAGGVSALAALTAPRLLLSAGSGATRPGATVALGVLAIACAALPQGLFLPLLARAQGTPRVAGLFAANLAGCVAGAHWIGFDVAAAHGRVVACTAAGAVALAAGLAGAWGARASQVPPADVEHPRSATVAPALLAGAGTAWLLGVQLVCLRLGVLWFGGMQAALGGILAASLVALAVGAALSRFLPQGENGVALVLAAAALATLWPFAAASTLTAAADAGLFVRALILVGPALLPFGALVPALQRSARGESGRRLGGLLVHETWGAALGVPLVYLGLVPSVGLHGTLAILAALGGALAMTLVRAAPRTALAAVLVGAGTGGIALALPPPALASPALSDPALERLAFEEDEHFAVTVVQDGVLGERTLLTDDFRATGTGDAYLYMRVLGHLPLLLHERPERVAVLAFGTGTSAGAVALHPSVRALDVLELSDAVCRQAPFFAEVNHDVLEDPRTILRPGDGRHTLARRPGAYDVVTMEPLLPDSPFAVYLYTREFYAIARKSLRPGGLLCQWVPPHALRPETFEVVVDAFARSFPWSGVFLFGTQVILVGGEAQPALAPEKFPETGDGGDALADALRELGLDTPAGVASRFVSSGARWPEAARPLTDGDPWIVYHRLETGAPLLARLPANLALLRRREEAVPAAWSAALGPEFGARLDGVRLLHRAREALEAQRAERFGVELPGSLAHELTELRGALARALPDDPEWLVFEREIAFEEARLSGYTALAAGRDGVAFRRLLDAAAVRPERADVHLFVAVAAERLGEHAVALSAAKKALGLCPRLPETPQGRALAGLAPELSDLLAEARKY